MHHNLPTGTCNDLRGDTYKRFRMKSVMGLFSHNRRFVLVCHNVDP